MTILDVMDGESASERKSNGPPSKCMQGTNNPASSQEPHTPVILACKLHRVPLARTDVIVVLRKALNAPAFLSIETTRGASSGAPGAGYSRLYASRGRPP